MRTMIGWLLVIIIALTACGQKSEQGQQLQYPQMKQMMLDILHSKEGEKVFQDVLSTPEVKQQLLMDDIKLQTMMQQVFASPKMQQKLEQILAKPEVAENFYKATEKAQQQLMKTLMKDPEYQKQLMNVIKDPVFEQQLIELTQSSNYRKEVMKIIAESLQIPTIKEKLQKLSQEQKKGEGPKQESEDQGDVEEEGQAALAPVK
jgi:spore germination protein D